MWWGSFCKSCGIELIDVGTYLMILVSISWWWSYLASQILDKFVCHFMEVFWERRHQCNEELGIRFSKSGVPIGIGYVSQLYLKMAKMRLLHAVLSKREVFDTSPFKTI